MEVGEVHSRAHCSSMNQRFDMESTAFSVRLSYRPRRVLFLIDTALLQVDDAVEHSLSPFFRWNFGYSDMNGFAVRDHGVKGVVATSTSDVGLLRTLNSRYDLAWNIQLCGDAPLSQRLGRGHD